MYIMIRTINSQEVAAGDVVVLKADPQFGQIGAFEIGGGVVGYAAERQPEGCLDMWTMMSRIRDNRVLCKVAVSMPGTVILATESPVFAPRRDYARVEREGYAYLAAK